jgi:hypothetical protein
MSLKPRGLYASYVAREKGTARKHNEVGLAINSMI